MVVFRTPIAHGRVTTAALPDRRAGDYMMTMTRAVDASAFQPRVALTRSHWLFAAGDARAGSTKQLASAVGEGVAALLSIRSYLQKHYHLPVIDPNS
jgi:thioredoxin reductase